MTASRCCVLYFGIHLASNHKGQAGNVEPDTQDDNGPKGTIGFAVAIEEVQVNAECVQKTALLAIGGFCPAGRFLSPTPV
jgi:hypothetical protein